MTDYTAIADHYEAQGFSSYQEALDAMLLEKSSVTFTGELMLTDIRIAAKIGMAATAQLVAGLNLAVSEGVVPDFVPDWLKSPGIDLLNGETKPTLQALAALPTQVDDAKTYIPQAVADAICSLDTIQVTKWPGITIGEIQNAVEGRAVTNALKQAVTDAQAVVDSTTATFDSTLTALTTAQANLDILNTQLEADTDLAKEDPAVAENALALVQTMVDIDAAEADLASAQSAHTPNIGPKLEAEGALAAAQLALAKNKEV